VKNENIIRKQELAGGVSAIISDHSRHYYGGYYHVCLEISAEVPLFKECFKSETEYAEALRLLGVKVFFRRKLEKMAVPAEEVESIRVGLLDSFTAHMLPYLQRQDFPHRFILSEYKAAVAKPRSLRR
jgi:hypothetical protein